MNDTSLTEDQLMELMELMELAGIPASAEIVKIMATMLGIGISPEAVHLLCRDIVESKKEKMVHLSEKRKKPRHLRNGNQ